MSPQHPTPLHLDDDGNILIATLVGCSSLDRVNGHEAAEELCQFFDEHGRRQLQLSFKNISHVSSAGMGSLLVLNKRLQGIVGRITLIHVTDSVFEVLVSIALNRLCSIVRDDPQDGEGGVRSTLDPSNPSGAPSLIAAIPLEKKKP